MAEFRNLPEHFEVEYVAECGEAFYLKNCFVPGLHIYCDECRETQYFQSKLVKHLSWEWDIVDDS